MRGPMVFAQCGCTGLDTDLNLEFIEVWKTPNNSAAILEASTVDAREMDEVTGLIAFLASTDDTVSLYR